MAKKSPAKASKSSGSATKAKRTETATPAAPRQPGVDRRHNHPMRAKHGYMNVLLTQAVPSVGQIGDLVKVRPGFARNYLIPEGLATFATPANVRTVERHRERLRQLEEAKKAELRGLASRISQASVSIEANANEEGHLYGSVNADQIAAALRAESFPVNADMVRIEGPLKELGRYTIKLQLGHDIETEFKLWVMPTHTEEAPPA
jgi:large subunit ribosomal protein L9